MLWLTSVICTILMMMAMFGAIQAGAGLIVVWAFARTRSSAPAILPSVTILKPVCGDEPLLAEAIQSCCVQDYPCFQPLIGAQDADDPALGVARQLQARFPACDIGIVDPKLHGPNRKVSNLMNMLAAAKHPVLVISDSDTHVRPDYLMQVVSALETPGTGLVTTVCAGEPASAGIAAQLGAMHLSHSFLPGALLAAANGRKDCRGDTMALRQKTLERAGGRAGWAGGAPGRRQRDGPARAPAWSPGDDLDRQVRHPEPLRSEAKPNTLHEFDRGLTA